MKKSRSLKTAFVAATAALTLGTALPVWAEEAVPMQSSSAEEHDGGVLTRDFSGNKIWRDQNGERHRLGGAAVESPEGSRAWYVHGELHRTDGPAVEYAFGTKEWYANGKLHRTDGPAVESASGTKAWIEDGRFHRTNGPAIEWADGSKAWYVDGYRLTEDQFNALHPNKKNTPALKP